MHVLNLILINLISKVFVYEIHRNACRRYGVFKIMDRNYKITSGIIFTQHARSSIICVKFCLDSPTCKTLNYKDSQDNTEKNCELLSTTSRSSKTIVVGWNHYQPISQTVCYRKVLHLRNQGFTTLAKMFLLSFMLFLVSLLKNRF